MKEMGHICQKLMLMLATVYMLGGCVSQSASVSPVPLAEATEYRLEPGDEVRITAYGLDALTNNYLVSDTGQISLPLIDNVQAKGKTVEQLQVDIARILLDRQILRSPSVNVQVTKYRPFYILGEVKSPGEYPYRPGMSVLTAISIAGGYTFRADQKNMTITRQVEARIVTGRARENTPIMPGDTIRVDESWF